MKSRHTRKTLAFSKICISFAAITIPSLQSVRAQLQNYVHALECALMNNLISETDSLYRAALRAVRSLMNSPETIELVETPLAILFSLSIMIPGDPSVSGFKLLEETLEVVNEAMW